MVHKSGTLTNLQLALLNAIALQSLVIAANNTGGVGGWLSDGGSLYITTDLIAKRAGYDKLTSYHHKLLIEMSVKGGYLKEFWFSRKRKGYSLTPSAWEMIGLNINVDTKTVDMFGEQN